MAKAYVIAVAHLPKRVTQGVDKEELVIVHFKTDLDVRTPVQSAFLYPARSAGAGREVVDAGFLDEVEIVLGADPRNVSRNVVLDVTPAPSKVAA